GQVRWAGQGSWGRCFASAAMASAKCRSHACSMMAARSRHGPNGIISWNANPKKVGVRKSPTIKFSRHPRQFSILSPYQYEKRFLRHGKRVSWPPAARAATVMTAPTELPDTLEMPNRRLRSSVAFSPCWDDLSSSSPSTLAVKNPARLAPPDAATMTGLGQSTAFSAVQLFESIHSDKA